MIQRGKNEAGNALLQYTHTYTVTPHWVQSWAHSCNKLQCKKLIGAAYANEFN